MDGNPRIWGLPEIRIKEEDDSRVPVEIGKGVLETKLIKTGQRLYLSKRQRDKLALGPGSNDMGLGFHSTQSLTYFFLSQIKPIS
jgi:hypothetical protein